MLCELNRKKAIRGLVAAARVGCKGPIPAAANSIAVSKYKITALRTTASLLLKNL
jgi:hypothetical protein